MTWTDPLPHALPGPGDLPGPAVDTAADATEVVDTMRRVAQSEWERQRS